MVFPQFLLFAVPEAIGKAWCLLHSPHLSGSISGLPPPQAALQRKQNHFFFLPSFQSGMLASPCCFLFPQFAPSKWGNGAPVVNVRSVLMAITSKESIWTRATIPPWWLGGPLWAAIGGPGLQKNCSPCPCPSVPGCRPGSTCWSMQRNGNGNSEFQNFPPLFWLHSLNKEICVKLLAHNFARVKQLWDKKIPTHEHSQAFKNITSICICTKIDLSSFPMTLDHQSLARKQRGKMGEGSSADSKNRMAFLQITFPVCQMISIQCMILAGNLPVHRFFWIMIHQS